jgi:uncharacterized protein
MSRVYLDSVAVIYLVEQVAPYHTQIDARLNVTGVQPVVSDLTRTECLVKPIRTGDTNLRQLFEAFFARVAVVGFPPSVFDRAAEIRAHYPFKTPDALHLAAAIEAGCDVFVTNDQQLKQFTGIAVEVI